MINVVNGITVAVHRRDCEAEGIDIEVHQGSCVACHERRPHVRRWSASLIRHARHPIDVIDWLTAGTSARDLVTASHPPPVGARRAVPVRIIKMTRIAPKAAVNLSVNRESLRSHLRNGPF